MTLQELLDKNERIRAARKKAEEAKILAEAEEKAKAEAEKKAEEERKKAEKEQFEKEFKAFEAKEESKKGKKKKEEMADAEAEIPANRAYMVVEDIKDVNEAEETDSEKE